MIVFINTFLSYLLVFVVIVALVVISLVLGVKIRHAKDAKKALTEQTQSADTVEQTEA